MSASFRIVSEQKIDGVRVFVSGKALGGADDLDAIAIAADVVPLMEFFSVSPGDALEGLGGDSAERSCEADGSESWFDAVEGLQTIRGLLRYLEANPAELEDAEAILQELRDFETILVGLAKAGVRWHLAVDF